MAQINPTVGAIEQNCEKIEKIILSHQDKVDLIVFPELALSGYPPEDLLFRPSLKKALILALSRLEKLVQDSYVVLGHPYWEDERCFNVASVFHQGKCLIRYKKQILPNEGVFDEKRYFTAGKERAPIFSVKGYRLGLNICEDLWHEKVMQQWEQLGIDGLICINASPFEKDKYERRQALAAQYSQSGFFIAYVNMVGGQDELVFDGQSFVFHEQKVVARAEAFSEALHQVSFSFDDVLRIDSKISPLLEKEALVYEALVCGTRDYVHKNGFSEVLLGLSGGIDSALTLVIAVDALGKDKVEALMLPSRYTAQMSIDDAQQEIDSLGVSSDLIPIEPLFSTSLEVLAPAFSGKAPDLTEENLQARIRGLLLMALSNKFGKLLLSTSNKSETAVGYATLYGDMAGAFCPLKDILKTEVYALAHYRNQKGAVIPERVLTRPPSAELAFNQKDQDKLPPYEILDGIIQAYMEEHRSVEELIQSGYAAAEVFRVIHLINKAEYKRRQAAPGSKISQRAFGKDWRCPITSGALE